MRKCIFILLCLSALHMHAQDQTDTSASFLDRTDFKVGYTGNIAWNNGLSFGGEYRWKESVKTKEKKRGKKTVTHQLLWNGNLGFTNNFFTKTDAGVFTNYGLTWRRTNAKGRQWSLEVNLLGYYRSFLPETYEVKGDDVSKIFLPGRSYYAPSLSIGFGKYRKEKKLTAWYFNANLMLLTPYNAGTLPLVSLQYGYRFNFKKK
ncbi:MAG: hypothetical protein ACJAQ4_001956 [Cryomorphaceae bacterium]|jgi:hypothetical protein